MGQSQHEKKPGRPWRITSETMIFILFILFLLFFCYNMIDFYDVAIPLLSYYDVPFLDILWYSTLKYYLTCTVVLLRANPPVRPHNFLGILKAHKFRHFTFIENLQ